jgi:hypothetical protein
MDISRPESGSLDKDLSRNEGVEGVEGSGPGLAIAGEVVELHGDSLALPDTAPPGAVFEVRVPIRPLGLTPSAGFPEPSSRDSGALHAGLRGRRAPIGIQNAGERQGYDQHPHR